jgi:phosphopentomutase
MKKDDLLVITADHGCDPTWRGTDHTREHIPVIARGGGLEAGSIGRRSSFADIGQTLAAYFGLDAMDYGESFLLERP